MLNFKTLLSRFSHCFLFIPTNYLSLMNNFQGHRTSQCILTFTNMLKTINFFGSHPMLFPSRLHCLFLKSIQFSVSLSAVNSGLFAMQQVCITQSASKELRVSSPAIRIFGSAYSSYTIIFLPPRKLYVYLPSLPWYSLTRTPSHFILPTF